MSERFGKALEALTRILAGFAGRRSLGALLGIAVALGVLVRLVAIATIPPSLHETHYLRDARAVFAAGSVDALRGSVHGWLPALGYARILERWPNAAERELRWLQFAFSVLASVLTWHLARRATGPRESATTALVHALTPATVFYGASAEPYAAHLLLVTVAMVAYVASVRRPSVLRGMVVVATTAVATLHHLVAAVNVAALVGHALLAGRRTSRARVALALPLLAGVAVALPMALHGSPGHARHWLGAEIPYFFSLEVVGSIVVFAALYDEVAEHIESAWREVLPWCFVVPVLFWLPYARLQYLLPGTVPMALVLGTALVRGARPRLVGAVVLFVALNVVSSVSQTLWVFRGVD